MKSLKTRKYLDISRSVIIPKDFEKSSFHFFIIPSEFSENENITSIYANVTFSSVSNENVKKVYKIENCNPERIFNSRSSEFGKDLVEIISDQPREDINFSENDYDSVKIVYSTRSLEKVPDHIDTHSRDQTKSHYEIAVQDHINGFCELYPDLQLSKSSPLVFSDRIYISSTNFNNDNNDTDTDTTTDKSYPLLPVIIIPVSILIITILLIAFIVFLIFLKTKLF